MVFDSLPQQARDCIGVVIAFVPDDWCHGLQSVPRVALAALPPLVGLVPIV
jgi:hypothetical protein